MSIAVQTRNADLTPAFDKMIATAKEFFRRADARSPDLIDLFTDDVQLWFPKFGVTRGKDAIWEMGGGLAKLVAEAFHDPVDYLFLPFGNALAVEGTTRGTTASGKRWAAGETPAGRFCNVFGFDGDLISRVHIYLDPDYGAEDTERLVWGMDRTW